MKKFIYSICLALVLILTTAFVNPINNNSNNHYLNYSTPLGQLLPNGYNPGNLSILVQKSSYTLFLKYNGNVIKSYPCVFGPEPIDDKLRQGDNCTPEGNFTITDIREHFIWGYFFEFDYPNMTSWDKHNTAKEYGVIPTDASIGGSVGIHGVVDGLENLIDSKNNWTEGCVSIKNQDILELAQYIPVGTAVKIIY